MILLLSHPDSLPVAAELAEMDIPPLPASHGMVPVISKRINYSAYPMDNPIAVIDGKNALFLVVLIYKSAQLTI